MSEYIITNFSAGEVSQRFYGRLDMPQYRNGCRTLENMLVRPEGSVTKRPGTRDVAATETASETCRLFRLQHTATSATVLEIGNQYIRFYKDGAQITSGASAYEITTSPWLEAELVELKAVQWGSDTLYLVHPSHAPRKLVRTGDTSWTLSTPTFIGITLATSWSAETSDVDTGNNAISMTDMDGSTVTSVTVQPVRCFITSEGESDALPAGLSENTIYWTKYDGTNGHVFYPTRADAVAGTNAVSLTDTGTGSFAFYHVEDFAAADHYPSVVSVFEQRLILGAPNYDPNALFGSKTMFPEDFSNTAGTAENAWQHNLYKAQFDDVVWAAAESSLLAGATNSLWRVGDSSQTLAANTVPIIRPQSSVGCAPVDPVLFQEFLVFIERQGKRVRAAQYHDDVAKYVSDDLTALAEHISGDGIIELAMTTQPWPILWALREDGELAAFSFHRTLGVSAWSRHTFGGVVESIASIPTDGDDQLWMVVKREIDGSVVRRVEYLDFAGLSDSTKAWYCDAAVEFDGGDPYSITGITAAPTAVATVSDATGLANDQNIRINGCETMTDLNGNTYVIKNLAGTSFDLYLLDGATPLDTSGESAAESGADTYGELVTAAMSGLGHLEGESVSSLVDGGSIADETVSSGSISLDRYGNRVVTGLFVRPVLQPIGVAAEPSYKKRISELYVNVYESGALKAGPDDDNLQPITFTSEGYEYGQLGVYYTGPKVIEFPGGFNREGLIYITQDYPLPLTILSIVAEVGRD